MILLWIMFVFIFFFSCGNSSPNSTSSSPSSYSSIKNKVTFQTVVRLPSNILITIFASLLSERRMIFVAQTLPVLTSCINALLASLSPFTWQHVFIPVLPPSLIRFI